MSESRRLDALLVRSAGLFPERPAVDDPDRCTLTYAQLADTMRLISGVLTGAGVGEGHRVGICAPKQAGTVAAIFGILHARGAYVPVDYSAPAERNAFIFEDCSVSALITTPALLEKLNRQHATPAFNAIREYSVPGDAGPPLVIAARAPGSQPAAPSPVAGLAYILYTSGSTGKPKGVMHSHSTALSFVDWCSEEFKPIAADRFSSHAPFHFDLSILDLYVPIKHGAAIVVIGEERGKQPLQLAELVASRRISVWYSTPSILRLLVEFGKLPRFQYPDLRLVLFAGEVFPPKHQRAVRALWSHPTYYNLYGPTETNVCTFDRVSEVPPDDYTGPITIGRVCSGDVTRVVDTDGREAARGQEGELLVTGGSVMLGYWNLPERNAAAFAEDADGKRWYRTGDIVVEQSDASFLFHGRRDRMVKRRGYRVELGEIEAALHRHENISEAAVVALPNAESGVLIKAFVSWKGSGTPSMIELKGIASSSLPAYMIPDRFVVLPALPKTSTDKLDYQKMREMD